jgi:hypothetical protein
MASNAPNVYSTHESTEQDALDSAFGLRWLDSAFGLRWLDSALRRGGLTPLQRRRRFSPSKKIAA